MTRALTAVCAVLCLAGAAAVHAAGERWAPAPPVDAVHPSSSPGTTRSIGAPGIGLHTPYDVHLRLAEQPSARCVPNVLQAVYVKHPERFVRKPPEPPKLPAAAWINQAGGRTAH